ncbi:YopX family protein [Paraliobacillus ryukyuensis]|uniref:YopX family protein n=1 Tax=Paraliobacillus ryukyuensis TaxID=200904 RepID=UPI0009A59D0A|nr:YopX family protein [Paraliobacillus ryukyuensis]
MNIIEFRGKTIDNDKWVYGDLIITNDDRFYISEEAECNNLYDDGSDLYSVDFHEVDQDSIGQNIGMKDKNGYELFSGQSVKFKDKLHKIESEGVIGFENGSFVIKSDVTTHYRWIDYEVEIID